MASKRFNSSTLSHLIRLSARAAPLLCPRAFHTLRTASPRAHLSLRIPPSISFRYSSSSTSPKKYTFEDIQSRLSPTSKPLILVDVREPGELASTGRIPGSYNIPISSAPEGLFLPADEFSERWGFEKPGEGDEVVFYCKAGVRSRAAAGMITMRGSGDESAGWEGVNVGEYPGSWVEWEGRGGEVER
ncbi:MAG: hypothetical protein MMC23_005459 [Stictis urceolatum]|nr:hypothetical protein [Stictis urceolata]